MNRGIGYNSSQMVQDVEWSRTRVNKRVKANREGRKERRKSLLMNEFWLQFSFLLSFLFFNFLSFSSFLFFCFGGGGKWGLLNEGKSSCVTNFIFGPPCQNRNYGLLWKNIFDRSLFLSSIFLSSDQFLFSSSFFILLLISLHFSISFSFS